MTTLRPLGPSVTLTGLAGYRRRGSCGSRASPPKRTSLLTWSIVPSSVLNGERPYAAFLSASAMPRRAMMPMMSASVMISGPRRRA